MHKKTNKIMNPNLRLALPPESLAATASAHAHLLRHHCPTLLPSPLLQNQVSVQTSDESGKLYLDIANHEILRRGTIFFTWWYY